MNYEVKFIESRTLLFIVIILMVCLEWREMKGHSIRFLPCVGPNSPLNSGTWGIYLFLIRGKTVINHQLSQKIKPIGDDEFHHLIIILTKKVKIKLLNHIYFDLWL